VGDIDCVGAQSCRICVGDVLNTYPLRFFALLAHFVWGSSLVSRYSLGVLPAKPTGLFVQPNQMLPSLHSALTKIDEASVEIASLQSNNPILPINSTLATLRPKSELRATFSRAAQTADATKILQVGEFLHCFTTLDEYDKQPQWYAKFVQLDSIKGYLSIYKDDPLLKTELRPDQKLYLHNAKMVDNGKKIVNGESGE